MREASGIDTQNIKHFQIIEDSKCFRFHGDIHITDIQI